MTVDHSPAIAHLARVDATLARIIERVGPCTLVPRAEGTHFDAIVRSIIYQQLSGAAASTIHGRLVALYRGRSPTPRQLLRAEETRLRSVGISRQKIGYLKDLAAKAHAGVVPLETLHELEDQAIIDALVAVKGVGRWTAQMFLIFRLGRPDILPELDLGIQKAIRLAYRKRRHPLPREVLRIGRSWSPFASIASWYLWRSLDVDIRIAS